MKEPLLLENTVESIRSAIDEKANEGKFIPMMIQYQFAGDRS